MTKLFPDATCEMCGSVLVPPNVVQKFKVPPDTDYVCLRCGRPYRWVGNPPKLTALVVVSPEEESEDD